APLEHHDGIDPEEKGQHADNDRPDTASDRDTGGPDAAPILDAVAAPSHLPPHRSILLPAPALTQTVDAAGQLIEVRYSAGRRDVVDYLREQLRQPIRGLLRREARLSSDRPEPALAKNLAERIR